MPNKKTITVKMHKSALTEDEDILKCKILKAAQERLKILGFPEPVSMVILNAGLDRDDFIKNEFTAIVEAEYK